MLYFLTEEVLISTKSQEKIKKTFKYIDIVKKNKNPVSASEFRCTPKVIDNHGYMYQTSAVQIACQICPENELMCLIFSKLIKSSCLVTLSKIHECESASKMESLFH